MSTPSRQLCSSANTWILHIPQVKTKTLGQLLCSKAVEFTPFRQPSHSHSILSCLQNYVKNSPPQTISQVISDSVFLLASPIYPPSPLVTFLLCAHVCVCVCVWGIQYYNYIIDYFWDFNVYIIVGLVKCAARSALLVRYGTVEMVAVITVITLTMICSFLQWACAGCPSDSELCWHPSFFSQLLPTAWCILLHRRFVLFWFFFSPCQHYFLSAVNLLVRESVACRSSENVSGNAREARHRSL